MHARQLIFLRRYNIYQQFANMKITVSQFIIGYYTICGIQMLEGRLRRRGSVLFPGSGVGRSL